MPLCETILLATVITVSPEQGNSNLIIVFSRYVFDSLSFLEPDCLLAYLQHFL